MQKLASKSKELGAFYEKISAATQYKLYPSMMLAIWEGVSGLPGSLGISLDNMTIQKLHGVLKNKMDKDERVAPLYEAVSVAVNFCPPEFRVKDIGSAYLNEAAKQGSLYQAKMTEDKSFMIAQNICALMDEEKSLTDQLSKMQEKDPSRKGLVARQKKIKSELKKLKGDKNYVKDSEKLLEIMKTSEDNIENANQCRFKIISTYNDVEASEATAKEKKQADITREKQVILADMENILSKLPAEPVSIVKEIKKAVDDIKSSDNLSDATRAYNSFKDNLNKLDKEIKGMSYDINKEVKECQKEADMWFYDEAMSACDTKINECKKAQEEAQKQLNKHQKEADESEEKVTRLSAINQKLNEMYSNVKALNRFESDEENGVAAQNDLKGKAFFAQMQRTFTSFSNRKDHNKGTHKNTEEYKAMDDKLGVLLALDPGSVTAEAYRNALTDLKNMALEYINKKKAQSFHWLPSKLRKYRLQYAKGLADMCNSQLDTIDATDFIKRDEAVDKYVSDLVAHPTAEKEYSKTEYFSDLADLKEQAVAAYKQSAGIVDEQANDPAEMQVNGMISSANTTVENVRIEQPLTEKKADLLQS